MRFGRGGFALAGAGLSFGFWDLAVNKCANLGIHPVFAAATMELTGAALLFLFTFVQYASGAAIPVPMNGLLWAIFGGGCLALGDSLYIWGAENTLLTQSGLIYQASEISAVILIGWLVLRDFSSLAPHQIAGLICAVIGIFLLKAQ